ncbi:TaqI-like C-terminal specificity domain-containing protein [Sulfuriferula sp.]|uniref:Eco57I restriction-modification methylase domain-containing protein n=1 Tax=Sulfuriferula sp. TaxID=2025307 RepID=UPI0027318070|nr:TaqI-like C-terminal specificity domain-containing protein [Sulfuriferula sp.]MDP2027390.1 TaqI-like C-terminal specificity domain-containing protein [Sulfuriferula sp.]
MSDTQLRADIEDTLKAAASGDLRAHALKLLSTLGYASNKTLDWPTQPQVFARDIETLLGGSNRLNLETACLADWQSVFFLFQLTNDELPTLAAGQMSFFNDTGVQPYQIESFIFLAVDLKAGNWSRTRLARITRELNRLFPMPVIMLYRHLGHDQEPMLSLAVINRRGHKRDASRDVMDGKISIIKDIDLRAPHAAHVRILESMALTRVSTKYVPSSFSQLYEAWMAVLDVKALNEKFYKELSDWYFWALREETGVRFPKGQPLDDSHDPSITGRPSVAMIRLLTRLIFVWFLKEKKLVPSELFDEKALAGLLCISPHQQQREGNYYKAILQNLFFATLNTETTAEDEDGNKQRVWREESGPKRLDKYLIHTVYRYKKEFKAPDEAIALFRKVPFLNGGLFECLDKLVTDEDLNRDHDLAALVVTEGRQTVLRVDGFSERTENPLYVPNELFFSDGKEGVDLNDIYQTKNRKYKPRGLLKIFESYKFTIEENTPVEEEVALDPELLGKVFENLLASYNPDTKTTARKKSGSFYTPREVVDYMVDEALVAYFEHAFLPSPASGRGAGGEGAKSTKLQTRPRNEFLDLGTQPGELDLPVIPQQAVVQDTAQDNTILATRLRQLLSYRHSGHDFNPEETLQLIQAIERLRVLDPACGSGAFPMGILQKLVHVLRKLDSDPPNALWKAQNRTPLEQQLALAKQLPDPNLREDQITQAQAALDKFDQDFADPDYADYARKLYLIEKCLYGVDIQPVAVQIAKLRFFISLVVEQKLDETCGKLTPLPNLETKIVAANTLLPIPRTHRQGDLFANPAVAEKEKELREANASHFAAKRFADKRKRKARILRLRDELVALLKADQMLRDPDDADRMAAWDPFDQNRHADFFDPEWMFGFSQGFDVLIGNPPYVRQESIKDDKPRYKPHYECYNGTADLYVYFYERSFQLLNPYGVLSFITSNRWFRAKYGEGLRRYMVTHTEMRQIIDFGDEAVFVALAYPTIVIATKRPESDLLKTARNDVLALNWDSNNPAHQEAHFHEVFAAEHFPVPQAELKVGGWQLEPPTQRRLLERLRKAGQPLGDFCQGHFYYGIKTGLNKAFVINREQRDGLIADNPNSAEIIKPFLSGKDIKRWNVQFAEQYFIKIESSENKQHPWSGLPLAEAEKLFAKTYPSIYAWFISEDRRQQLIDRTDQGRYFWELRSCAYWEKFEQPKIIYPDIYLHQSFAWDEEGLFCANTAYFIPNAEKWLVGVLNSSVCEWFYDQISTRMQGGYLRAFSDKMQALPVPEASREQRNLIEACINAISRGLAAPEYERLLNGLVYELFFPEELHAKGIHLFDACAKAGIADWPAPDETAGKTGSAKVAQLGWNMRASSTADEIFHPRHPIYGMLFELQTLDVVRIIEGQA